MADADTRESKRLPLQDGFDRLCEHCDPPKACKRINDALQENDLRLWCDGALLALDYIIANLVVVLRYEADGHPRCVVEPHGTRLGFDPSRPHVWEVEGIERLLPEPVDKTATARRKPGKMPRYNWPLEVAAELIRRLVPSNKIPMNDAELARAMLEFCGNEFDWEPPDSEMRATIARLLRRARGISS
jgi:hypothetical protein